MACFPAARGATAFMAIDSLTVVVEFSGSVFTLLITSSPIPNYTVAFAYQILHFLLAE